MPTLVDLFLDLAAIDALSLQERPVADFIIDWCRRRGLSVCEDDSGTAIGGSAGNLIIPIGDGGDMVLLAHMDTARPTTALRPLVQGDRITSDGTTILGADNRAGIAVLLNALDRLLVSGPPDRGFTLAFTICEESTLDGSRRIALDERIRMGVVFDSALPPGNFIARSYGAQRFRARLTGRPAHAGIAPETGIDAIATAARAVARLRLGRLDDTTTANVGRFAGGSAVNVVPELAEVEGEVRALEAERVTAVVGDIEAAFREEAAGAGAGLKWSADWDFHPYRIDERAPVYSRVRAALAGTGLDPTPAVSPGGSDANSLNARGIPTINLGIGARNPHANDEYILIDDLRRSAEVALALMRGPDGKPQHGTSP